MIADRISVLTHEGTQISPDDRDRIHHQLQGALEALERLYVLIAEHVEDWSCYADTDETCYTDTTPVWSAVQPGNRSGYPAEAVYCGDLGWADYLPPGAEVVIEKPPHRREEAGRQIGQTP